MTDIADLDTPAVTIDLDTLAANIARVQRLIDDRGIGNRPHIKTHKLPDIARMQLAAGAIGITCQKLDEAAAFIAAGIDGDILLTFNILGRHKTDRLMELSARARRLAVVADNETVLRGLSEAGVRHGRDVPLLIECDTGFGRNGAGTVDAVRDLARLATSLPRIRLEGLMTFPSNGPNALPFMSAAIDALSRDGIPVPVISGGGSPALADLAAFPIATEHRAGTYVYNDGMMVRAGIATWDDCAMRIRATVVSTPTGDRAILDSGSKLLTRERYGLAAFGHIVEYPDAVVANLSEEHGIVDTSRSAAKPKVGEVLTVIPNHCCVVSNMVDEVYGVRNGKVEKVWRIAARGGVH